MKCFGNCLGLKTLEISGKTELFIISVTICRNGKAQLIRYSIKPGRKRHMQRAHAFSFGTVPYIFSVERLIKNPGYIRTGILSEKI